jgi:hypothetical protein
VVYAKRPFAGPEAVLAYLSRYTHRVAISNQRLIAMDEHGVTFRWKDYRAKGATPQDHDARADEFMRRFLLHVLPSGFHRIRHYGLLANAGRRENLARFHPAELCLPALRRGDDRGRDPDARATDPGAADDIATLMEKYDDLPMDLADASLVWLAGKVRHHSRSSRWMKPISASIGCLVVNV